MQAYRIVDWDKKFEVNRKGQSVTSYLPVEYRRKGALKFIRIPVDGLRIDPLLDEIIGRAWITGQLFHWAVLGVYTKLVEIAADQEREYRGWLLDPNQKPIDAKYFANRFREPDAHLITKVFEILCHSSVNLLEIHEIPEIPENSGAFINQLNQHKTTQPSDPETRKKVEQQKKLLFDY